MTQNLSLRNAGIRTKLILMVAAPILVVLYFTVASFVAETRAASQANDIQELAKLSIEIGDLINETQRERGRTSGFVSSAGTVFVNELAAQRAATDAQTAIFREFIATFDSSQFGDEFNAKLEAALSELNRLETHRSSVNQLSISVNEAVNYYTEMDDLFLDVIGFILKQSSDGEIVNITAGYFNLLHIKDRTGLERAMLTAAFANDAFLPGQLVQFSRLAGEIDAFEEAFLEIAPSKEIEFYNNTVQGQPVEDTARFIQLAFNKGAEGNFGVDPDVWFAAVTGKIDLMKQAEDQIAATLIDRAVTLQQQAQFSLIALNIFRVAGIVISLILVFVISRLILTQVNHLMVLFNEVREGGFTARGKVTSQDELGQMTSSLNQTLDSILLQVDNLTNLFSQIGMGDFDARAEVLSDDALGQLTISLNATLDNTLALIQSREERDAMQASIMKLLEEVADVADGDLTVEAEVTADMTGAIADSFNFMIQQLRTVIGDVQDATLQVSASANEVQATAEHLAQGSESQAAQIVDTSAAIDEMTISIQQVSDNAALSATVGEQATANAQQGARAVQDTIQGMNQIREQVQETAKRIKRLGESSQEIGEIVQLINDIADRTSILALNASIQAAMAGEAGRGFAVVAEEVERLAERSTEATKQINTLIRAIQNETNEAVAAMESTTREVVKGHQLANEAGQSLVEIESVSNRLSELIQSISLAAKQQARGSETVARSMSEIAEVTQQTAAGTKQAAVSINNLAALADDLRGSVSAFKLPDSNGRA